MLDVGTANTAGEDDADLAVFVDRLAAAGSDRATSAAQAQLLRTLADGPTPPGLRRLAEALAASVSELPPPPRRPSENASVVAAVRDNALVVLDGFDTAAVAGTVAALLADGRRVVVTAATPAELAAVRGALPAGAVDRALTDLPGLAPAELRELRRLLATSTPERRARAGQELPPESTFPPVAEIVDLCTQAAHGGATRRGCLGGAGAPHRARREPAGRRHVRRPVRRPFARRPAAPRRARVGVAAALRADLQQATRRVRPDAAGRRAGRRRHRAGARRPAGRVRRHPTAGGDRGPAALPRLPQRGWTHPFGFPLIGPARGAARARARASRHACAGDRGGRAAPHRAHGARRALGPSRGGLCRARAPGTGRRA